MFISARQFRRDLARRYVTLWKPVWNTAKEECCHRKVLCFSHFVINTLVSSPSHPLWVTVPPQPTHIVTQQSTLSEVPLHSSTDPSALQYAAKHWHKRCKGTQADIFATFCPVSASSLCMILCNLSLYEQQWNDLRIYWSVCLRGGIIVDKLNFIKLTVKLLLCLSFDLCNLMF